MNGVTFTALIALVPAMVGPLPIEAGSRALVVALCGGGAMEISLGRDDQGTLPPLPTTPCCAKGCHTGERKKLVDRGQ